jgi:hypothetical protein
MDSPAITPQISAESTPVRSRLRTISDLDGRTRAARRARDLAAAFAADLGGTLTAAQRLAVDRAAALCALAEDARARRLAGDTTISLEDVVRVDNAAQRAVRMLGIKSGGKPKTSNLNEYLAGKYGTPAT